MNILNIIALERSLFKRFEITSIHNLKVTHGAVYIYRHKIELSNDIKIWYLSRYKILAIIIKLHVSIYIKLNKQKFVIADLIILRFAQSLDIIKHVYLW